MLIQTNFLLGPLISLKNPANPLLFPTPIFLQILVASLVAKEGRIIVGATRSPQCLSFFLLPVALCLMSLQHPELTDFFSLKRMSGKKAPGEEGGGIQET